MLIQIIFTAVLFLACGIAVHLGRRSETVTAVVLVVASISSAAVQAAGFQDLETGILAVDMILLVLLVTLALFSDRFWPLYAAGFHCVATVIHFARIVDHSIAPGAYGTAEAFWAYPVLIALVAGTVFEARKRPKSHASW